jgi:hypothetical protein
MKPGRFKPRTTPLRSTTPIRRKPRKASETRRIYGTRKHQKWLRDHPCLGCACSGSDDYPHHLHHTANGGKGRKADASTLVPLCYGCHWLLHQHGPETFQRAHADFLCGRTLESWAETYADAWSNWSGLTPLSAIVPGVMADILEGSE